ncbi:MAG: hypothetical protein K6L81_08985 [Agarilytica sp.]
MPKAEEIEKSIPAILRLWEKFFSWKHAPIPVTILLFIIVVIKPILDPYIKKKSTHDQYVAEKEFSLKLSKDGLIPTKRRLQLCIESAHNQKYNCNHAYNEASTYLGVITSKGIQPKEEVNDLIQAKDPKALIMLIDNKLGQLERDFNYAVKNKIEFKLPIYLKIYTNDIFWSLLVFISVMFFMIQLRIYRPQPKTDNEDTPNIRTKS